MDDAKASEVGARLAEERTRISLGVGAMAKACGVTPDAQRRYERGYNFPGGAYLQAAFESKIDIQYVLTGYRVRDVPGAKDVTALYEASGPWSANLLGSLGIADHDAFRESLRGVDVAVEGSARVRNALVSVAQAYAQTANRVTARAPSTAQPVHVDEALLRDCIAGVEEFLQQERAVMPLDKKAALIVEVYGELLEQEQRGLKPASRANVVELARRRAA